MRLCANVRSLRVIIGKSFKRQIIIEPASESEIYVQRCDFTGGHRQKFQEIRIEHAVWGFIGSLKATLTYLNCESATTTGGKVN